MPIEFVEMHPAESPKLLNTEWFILRNDTEKTFTTRNCALEVSRGSKQGRSLGTMEPGFTMAPGESMRVITGNPGRKAHGKAPEDEIPNYHLFLGATYLKGDGLILTIRLRSLAVASGEFQRAGDRGVASSD